jgi:hypothetical protein
MTRTTAFFLTALGLAAFAGCYTGPNSELSAPNRGANNTTDGTEPKPGDDSATPKDGAPVASTGLPCDVAKVLSSSCTDCHGRRPTSGAPNALVTYEDLAAPSKDEPGKSVAEVSLERMKDAKQPMPPDGKVSAADIATLEKWVGAGMPRGTCGGTAGPEGGADGGTSGDGGTKPADASADAATVCTSGTTWAQGAPASELMHPGKTCIACHSAMQGPPYTLAGTVYPTIHEPNDCNGASAPNLSVLIIDATGKTHTMPVNEAGNFMRVTSIPMPYRAMVVDGVKVREMKTPQTDGDCNGCHSEQGNHSPGRVMAP